MHSGIDFPGRQEGEHTVSILHRHWFVFVRSIFTLVLLGAAPWVAIFIWSQLGSWTFTAGTLSFTIIVILGALYYLFLWILLYGYWLDYYLDVFVITNKRIVDIEQSGLFGRTVSEERLYRIQDVTSESHGIIPTMLHYGNVYVQTAGKKERFIFPQVSHPELVARQILELTDKIDDRLEHPGDSTKVVERAAMAQSQGSEKET